MKKLVKYKEGDIIPDGARFIKQEKIIRHDLSYTKNHRITGGWFSSYHEYDRMTPVETYYVYEVDVPVEEE